MIIFTAQIISIPMKKIIQASFVLVACALLFSQAVSGQSFIKKVKSKAEDAAIDKMFKTNDESSGNQGSGVYSPGSDNSPSNTRGGGLTASRPDVMKSIGEAESLFGSKDYADARYAVRQAIMGIELEIGDAVLKDLPGSIAGLPAVQEEDEVTSTGIGFVGLVIRRVYREGDQELGVTIGNDAAMLSAANMYLSSGAYGTSSQEENIKQTKFKDHRAVIRYDEYSGYELDVPFGQSSVLVTNGINFSSEDEFMSACEAIDIEAIKNKLGEQ